MSYTNPLLFPPERRDFEDTRIDQMEQRTQWSETEEMPLATRPMGLGCDGGWEPTDMSPLEHRLTENQKHRLQGLYEAVRQIYRSIIHA